MVIKTTRSPSQNNAHIVTKKAIFDLNVDYSRNVTAVAREAIIKKNVAAAAENLEEDTLDSLVEPAEEVTKVKIDKIANSTKVNKIHAAASDRTIAQMDKIETASTVDLPLIGQKTAQSLVDK